MEVVFLVNNKYLDKFFRIVCGARYNANKKKNLKKTLKKHRENSNKTQKQNYFFFSQTNIFLIVFLLDLSYQCISPIYFNPFTLLLTKSFISLTYDVFL